ncbi:MAG: cysteine desulfurase [Candidatus Aenigmarchaeota archaeon]|nr:cysteine desulfurase [Candidatus Aenigmarchaeota archaeon]
MRLEKYRKDFPILKIKINGKRLVYLDSAATSQKPKQVIEAITDYYQNYNANIHRSIHSLGEEATKAYEEARETVAKFINAEKPEEVIFVRNTTEALNVAAFGLRKIVSTGKILLSEMEHHSNLIPWQQLAKINNAKLDFVGFDQDGYLKIEELKQKARNAKVIAITQASNVLGTINPIKEIAEIASDAIIVVDGAQSVPHMPVDVQELDIDILAFSAHKMLGPTGIGVLYAREELLKKMEPFIFGSEMIKEVSFNNASWNDLPYKFEAGTPHIAGAVGFKAAIDYLQKIGMKNIRRHDQEITDYALKKLSKLVNIIGPKKAKDRSGLIAFTMNDVHPHDIAAILNEDGIAIRSGHHCAMPLHTKIGINASARASFYLYNTKQEIDLLVKSLEKVKRVFEK